MKLISRKTISDQSLDDKSNGRYRPPSPHIIEMREVVKVFENAAGKFRALDRINLQVDSGEFLAVVGKSGSGKSTLMNIIAGIDRPTSGEVVIGEIPVHKLSEGKITSWRGQTLGVVFQFFQLLPTLTVIENIILPMDFCHKYSLAERRYRALGLLEEVDLVDQANKLPATLSGGQQQRVAIARSLANDPRIIVADEPTGNLDSKTASSIFNLFEKLVKEGKTILMVSHDYDLVKRVPRTVFLADGKIVRDELTGENYDLNQQELYEMMYKGQAGELQDTAIMTVREHVSRILDDRQHAARRLKEELLENSTVDQDPELIYQAILDEVNARAHQAERDGKPTEVRSLWKILLDATE